MTQSIEWRSLLICSQGEFLSFFDDFIVNIPETRFYCGNRGFTNIFWLLTLLVGLLSYPIQIHAQDMVRETASAFSDEDKEKRDRADQLYAQSLSLDAAGKPREAEPILAEALELRSEILGQEHPDTLKAMHDYAYILGLNGKVQMSRFIFGDVLKLRRDTLGPKHPSTLHSQSLYAGFLLSWDLPKSALTLFMDLKEKQSERLGPNHPETLKIMENYALALTKAGRETEAIDVYQKTLTMQRIVLGNDHLDTISTSSGYAFLLLNLNQNAESEKLFREILSQRRRLLGADHHDTIRAMTGVGATLINLERAAEAEPIWKEAWSLHKKVFGADHPETLRIQHNHATSINSQGKYEEAEPLFLKVLQLREKVLGREHADTILTLSLYAGTLSALNKIDASETQYKEVLRLRRKVLGRNSPLTIEAQQSFARALFGWNKLLAADKMFEEAIMHGREIWGFNDPKMIELESSHAMVLRRQGRIAEAEYKAETAYIFAGKFLDKKHETRLLAANNYALLLYDNDKIDQAERLYLESFQGHRQVHGSKNTRTLYAQINYASFLTEAGKLEKAETVIWELREQLVENPRIASNLRFLIQRIHAEWLQKSGRLEDAESIYANLFLAEQASSDDPGQGNRFLQKQLALLRLQIPQMAHLALEPSRASLESLRSDRANVGFHPQEQVQTVRDIEKESEFFQIFANAAWEKTSKRPEFKAGSRTKRPLQSSSDALTAEVFLALQNSLESPASNALARVAARRASGLVSRDLEVLARERQDLLDQWKVTNNEWIAAIPESEGKWIIIRSNLQSRMHSLEMQIEKIDKRLRAEAPEYFALIRPEPLSLKAGQKLLGPDESALIIVPTELGTHTILMTDSGLRWVRSDWNSDKIDAAVRRLLWDVGADVAVDGAESAEWSEEGSGAYPYSFGRAYALYHELIAPIADELKGKEHVFISASGSLSSLPFGLLVSEIPEGENGDPEVLRSAKWFADDHALIQIPTLQSLEFLRKYRASDGTAAKSSFLGIGDPVLAGKAQARGVRRSIENSAKSDGAFKRVFQKNQTRGGASIADISELRRMARLPGTATELAAMWEEFGKPSNALYLADQATEDFVRTGSLNADVIAFATHGLLAGEINGAAEPGLVLTPPSEPSETNDGYLSASEISALKMNADWVILSACNTAAGDGGEGAPGLSGLARSFFYAGARNLLASHWPVRDDVAAKLTVRTISIANNNPQLSRAEAFQEAMREIRNDKSADSENDTWAHPNAWAPFSLIGDGAR